MAGIAKLAWRNLGRNRRRTLITGTALMVGTGLCVATYGLMDGLSAEILHALTRLDMGHAQVHRVDYPKKKTLSATLPQNLLDEKQVQSVPEVRGMAPRVYAFALAGHKHKSAGVQLVGIDPGAEVTVTEVHQHVWQGKYLEAKATPWPAGEKLSDEEKAADEALTDEAEQAALAEIDELGELESHAEGDGTGRSESKAPKDLRQQTDTLASRIDPPPKHPPPVLLGRDLARILKLKVGDEVFVMTETVDGMAAEVFGRVRGIIHTGTGLYDRRRIYMHITDLQRFLRLSGRVHEIALAVQRPSRASLAVGPLKALVRASKAPEKDRERAIVQSWDTIRPDIKSMIQLNDASSGIMVFVIFVVATLVVMATMLMAVFERTRELGMLKAIGMTGPRIVALIVSETLFMVVLFAGLGTGLGVGLDAWMMLRGVDLSAIVGTISFGGVGVNPVIHGVITVKGVVMPVIILGFLCFLAAFYPAVRAARMRPAAGMREA